ncbi:MAG: hypothetical protein OXM55_04525 [Bdellovibrionales bacterium]|nr:hypothetical protein [Bdellovibrionales bacterium]
MNKSTISSADEIWGILKEVADGHKEAKREMEEIRASHKEDMKEIRASQKETEREIQKIGGRFNQRWGALVESLVEGKLVKIFQDQGIDITQTHTCSHSETKRWM